MSDFDIFISLAGVWHPIRDEMREAELELDLKFVKFLQGKGPASNRTDIRKLNELCALESKERDQMDKLIRKYVS